MAEHGLSVRQGRLAMGANSAESTCESNQQKQPEENMSKRTIGIVLIVVGVVAVIVSLGADAMGIGNGQGMGWKQALGAVVGVIIVAVGAWYWPGFPASKMISGAPREVTTAPASRGRRKGRASKSAHKTTKRRRR